MGVIELVATFIGIVSAALAVWKWLLPRKIAESESLRKARGTVDYYYADWNTSPYASRNSHLIPYTDFLEVDRHRSELVDESDSDRCAYLFVCAVVHRKWGQWWVLGKGNPVITHALSTLLNGRAGWRPVWRAAYLLELLSAQSGLAWMQQLPKELTDDRTVQDALKKIGEKSTVRHLEAVTRANNSHLRDKAFEILEDLRAHFGETVELKYPDPENT